MRVVESALSLNVPEPATSARWAIEHFGFTEAMAADGFISLAHPDAGFGLIYLRTGLSTFKPAQIAGDAGQGTLIAFVVDDVDAEHERLVTEGVEVITPPETEPWGERYAQYLDPNGVVFQLVTWQHEATA